MLFTYHAIDQDGRERDGSIEAPSQEVAITSLQRRNLVIASITSGQQKGLGDLLQMDIAIFNSVSNKEIVIFSRQIATLFEAQVSALRIFRLLAAEVDNKYLQKILTQVADDIQGGSPISAALQKHPKAFSKFYVNMVRAGEESGKLSQTFNYLADYLDRSYDTVKKAENALMYPAFVIVVFFAVMALMMTVVIPKITSVITSSGEHVPIYTQIVISTSDFLVNYGIFILIGLIALAAYGWRLTKTHAGQLILDKLKLSVPYIGDLYKKLYLARLADNFSTMLLSGVSALEALEITSSVVDNAYFEDMLKDVELKVRNGSSVSAAMGEHPDIPGIMTAMIRVGEETGELGKILTTLAHFYNREVSNAVDTLVGLIEPVMVVALGLGVGILLAAVLLPIYSLAGAM